MGKIESIHHWNKDKEKLIKFGQLIQGNTKTWCNHKIGIRARDGNNGSDSVPMERAEPAEHAIYVKIVYPSKASYVIFT